MDKKDEVFNEVDELKESTIDAPEADMEEEYLSAIEPDNEPQADIYGDETLFGCVLKMKEALKSGEIKFGNQECLILSEYVEKNGYDNTFVDVYDIIEIVSERGDCESIYNLADVYDIDMDMMDALSEAMEATGNPEYIYKFAKDKDGASVGYLSEAEADTGSVEYIKKFAADVVDPDMEALSKGIANSVEATAAIMYDFGMEFKDKHADQRVLSKAIAKTGDFDYMLLAVKNFDSSDKQELTKGVARLENAQLALRFLDAYPKASVNTLSKGVVKSEDLRAGKPEEVEAVCQFIDKYTPDNIADYEPVFQELGNEEYLNQFNLLKKKYTESTYADEGLAR